ncbi:Predicted N-acyltransferase, GNAT family [Lutibacter oricola]|uniref:Predicted N-acyltransferase, GNAT family n=1 Tax=Lutibacter oricola TaxID=762486 RepID=A0A1H3FR20_9FLAO|nr:GNAT family N-acetyltransferase [Lutibacter oricola]SDX92604.1 Predicted N-acyltransferase, GNAT family [Lutibacter oricola]
MIEVRNISAKETYAIRKEVLRKGVPKPVKFEGDEAKDTFHLGAFENEQLIAVSSYMKVANHNFKGEQYQLRGMATLPHCQGKGAGKKMLTKAIKQCRTLKIDCLWCNARIIAVNFYKKQGFKTVGTTFDIEYIGPHYVMYQYLV